MKIITKLFPGINILRKSIFTINVVIFSFNLTFAQQNTIPSRKISDITVQLPKDSIVNIGYGTLNNHAISGSIATVNSDMFNKGNIQNPIQLIQGKVAGLDISKQGGDPNGSYYLRLRGLNTIHGYTQPLVVIDGIIGASIDNVDPNDIESITVLKDASSAAIYGTRGSNGVILMETRKGKNGAPVINYNVYTSAETVAKNEPAMNPEEWRVLNAELGGIGTDFGSNTDWFKEIEQTAISQVHNLSISGGTDKTSYRASVNYRQGEGVEINTGYNQLNGRVSITQKALKDKLTMNLNMGATERQSQYGFSEAFRYASIFNPTSPVKSDDPAYTKYDGYFQQIVFDYYNPVSILKLNTNEGKNRILNLSLKGTYEIVKGLNIDALYSKQNSGDLTGVYYSKSDYWGGMNRNGLASRQEDNSSSRLFESTFHFNKEINSPLNLNLNLIGGYSYQDFTNEGFYAQGGDFLTDEFTFNNLSAALDFKNGKGTITSYKNSNKLVAFFGRMNLNFNNRFFLNASLRKEGSSRFGSSNKWGLFPAFGGGMDIIKGRGFIDNLKFRLGYGITGNLPTESYLSLPRMDQMGNTYYNGTSIPLYSLVSYGNPSLKWEQKSELDAGLDFSILKSRLSGSFDFYTNTSTSLLYQYNIPSPVYYSYSWVWLNPGIIRSSGLELTINFNVIKKADFAYSITLTRSHNLKNTLVSLSENYNGTELKYGINDLGDLGSPGGCCAVLVRSQEGKPIGQLIAYVDKGIDENGRIILADQNGDGQIDSRDWAVVGNGLPEYLTGFCNELAYKNLDLSIFFRSVSGHDLVNSYRAIYEVPNYIIAYNVPETTANMRNAANGKFLTSTGGILTSSDIENASFISLDNISLGYTFKLAESSQFSKIRMYLEGNNLFYITRYKGPDPNPRYSDNNYGVFNNPLLPGIDRRETWPRTRSVTFGANVIF